MLSTTWRLRTKAIPRSTMDYIQQLIFLTDWKFFANSLSVYFLFPPFSIPPFSPYAGNKNFFLCQVSKLVKFDNKAIYALHRNKSERVNDSTLGLYSFF